MRWSSFRSSGFNCKIGHGAVQIKLMATVKVLAAILVLAAGFGASKAQAGN
jgi:hypothetical protein